MTRMTAAQFAAMKGKPGRQPGKKKYGNRKVRVDGRTFDSKAEARRYGELRQLERAGEVFDLECQVPIPLEGQDGPLLSAKGRALKYIADFVYRTKEGVQVVEDAKGFETKDYKLKRAILRAQGITIREIRYG